jgi:hypothetical protein
MSGWQTQMALVIWAMLTLEAMAQENQSTIIPANPPQFPRLVPPPPTLAPPKTIVPIPSGNVPHALTLIPSPPVAGGFTQQTAEHQSVPAKVELSDGTKLAGDLYSEGPLRGIALFGKIAIPLNQIRGIDWQAKSDQDEQERKAKVVLVNDDSLTVTLTIPAIHLKTSWGYAQVELAKVRSMVVTAEKYKWEDTPLGRQLVPDEE